MFPFEAWKFKLPATFCQVQCGKQRKRDKKDKLVAFLAISIICKTFVQIQWFDMAEDRSNKISGCAFVAQKEPMHTANAIALGS